MAGVFQFTPQEYQEAAHKWRKDLLMLPIIGCEETLKHMTKRPGIRYKESVGELTGSAQFAPYKSSRRTDADLHLDFRTLETFFGSVCADFEPNSAASTLLGMMSGSTKGDGQKQTLQARHVLALIARGLSEKLNDAIWSAVRNANGDTSQDLFNGFDTITATEIAGGNISASKGNYIKLTEEITELNACNVAKEILFGLDPILRAQELNMYCTQEFVDMYNESYQSMHGALPYNLGYEKNTVEGSNNKLHMIPLTNKLGSKFIHISPRSNMLVGFDQMGDMESVEVEKYAPFVLTYIATMFFGVQFESIDRRRLKVVELVTE
ncbi:MAG: hypothetical protein K6F89_05265 [Prevotella sp.]|nr:hypothetical protein [Prevotella sp.]